MVVNTILTNKLENIHVSISSNRTRPQSVPPTLSKTRKRSPYQSKKERKRRSNRQLYVPERPPFINYASSYIEPYRCLTPILINHDYNHRRLKSSKRSKRKKTTNDKIISNQENPLQDNSSLTDLIRSTDPIDLWPLNSNSFDMDFIRKRQIAIDNTSYREIIHTWKPTSINNLSTLIKDLGKDKNLIDIIWIIYYWISQNILYDMDNNRQRVEDIFLFGKTNCDGYATILQLLCQKIGINCLKVCGYAKDSHYRINQTTFSQVNHTWNVVQLDDNQWYLIDSAWGSGYLNNKHEYKKSLQPYYFLTRPECLIYNHFPIDSQWQLLSKSISILDYCRLPYLHSYYFIYDLTIVSPRFSSMISFDSIESLGEVLVQAPNDIQLSCSSKYENKSTSLTQYDSNRQIWQCLFAPYKSGFHTLVIYANRSSISNSLINVIELGMEVPPKDFNKRKILPITYGKFIEYKCQIYTPLNGTLKRGTKVTIHCRIPNASHGRIATDGNWLEEIKIKDENFKQEIMVPEKEITVYAQFNNKKLSDIYYGLIRYVVEK